MVDGRYIYMSDLAELDGCVLINPVVVPCGLQVIATPLHQEAWSRELRLLPDRKYARYIERGLESGFCIGYDYGASHCKSARRNMLSATQHPEPIERYISAEVEAGRILGPLPAGTEGVHVSRFGVIPKPHQPGKWRLITDGIEPRLCSLSYASTDDAVRTVQRLGRGTVLAKFDLEAAYRLIPVHPQDRLLLGMRWKGDLYVDRSLPFGLRSAPKILRHWLMPCCGQHGVREAIHYLDDFLVFGPPHSEVCGGALHSSLRLCEQLGVRVAPHKLEGPGTAITFLGILIDTDRGILQLPPEKLSRLKLLVSSWKGRKCCCKRELLSLIGQLQHACKVVRAGRTFLRRMIDLSSVASELHHRIRLNGAFRSDLQWWDTFMEGWNGLSLFGSIIPGPPVAVVTSDALGHWGCGAFTSSGHWFQLQWPRSWEPVHITVKELLPVVMACALWGMAWQGQAVRCHCDNEAVVAILKSGTSKNPLVMHLMRCLFLFSAHYQLYLDPVHLPGKVNVAADNLSRDNLPVSAAGTHSTPQPHPPPSRADAGVGASEARLDGSQLEGHAAFYFVQGLANSRLKTYQSGHSLTLSLSLCLKLFCVVLSHIWRMKASSTGPLRPTSLGCGSIK